MLPIPGLELERHADGRFTLRAVYRGWTGPTWPVTLAEWDALARLEPTAFALPGRNTYKQRRDVVVHCWGGLLAASPHGSASWSACDSGTQAARAYTEALLGLAIQKKGCAPGTKDVLWRFSDCFTERPELADPALQARLAALQQNWTKQDAPGADILSAARSALRAAKKEPIPAHIARARDKVLAFGRHQEALRAIVQGSFTPFEAAEQAGGRDALILSRVRSEWLRDIRAQDANYIAMLEELARLHPPALERAD
jgi:hypothetical protein